MAEGGNDTLAVDGHEECLDWTCELCAENDLMNEAVGYCKNCDEYLCSSCFQYHGRYNKTHKVLGTEEKAHWGTSELIQDTGIQCPDHRGQTISMYCGLHDVSCCPVCAVFKHGESCKLTMSYIPQIAKGIRTSPEFKTAICNMDELLTCFSKFQKDITEFQETLNVTEEECARRIEVFHNELLKHLKKLKKSSIKELKHIHKEINVANRGNKEMCEQAKQKLYDMKQQMQTTDSVSEPLLFVNMKNSQKVVAKCREVSASLGSQKQYTLTFQQNNLLVNMIQTGNSFGEFVKVNYIPPERTDITTTVASDLGTPLEINPELVLTSEAMKEKNVFGEVLVGEEDVFEPFPHRVEYFEEVDKLTTKPTIKITDNQTFDDLLCELENVKEIRPAKETDVRLQIQRYNYYGDQWSPQNRKGKKKYTRDFLLQFRFEPVAMLKPRGLSGFPDIILDKPDIDRRSSGHGIAEYKPNYVWQSTFDKSKLKQRKVKGSHQLGPGVDTHRFDGCTRGDTISEEEQPRIPTLKDTPANTPSIETNAIGKGPNRDNIRDPTVHRLRDKSSTANCAQYMTHQGNRDTPFSKLNIPNNNTDQCFGVPGTYSHIPFQTPTFINAQRIHGGFQPPRLTFGGLSSQLPTAFQYQHDQRMARVSTPFQTAFGHVQFPAQNPVALSSRPVQPPKPLITRQLPMTSKEREITFCGDTTPNISSTGLSLNAIADQLHFLIVTQNTDNENVFDWIDSNVDEVTIKEHKFIRALMTSVCNGAIKGSRGKERVEPRKISDRNDLLQKYLDHRLEYELQALYALQELVTKLDHPTGVLRHMFDTLYDEDIISEEAFKHWQMSEDELDGKAAALRQVVQFFRWLHEEESDS